MPRRQSSSPPFPELPSRIVSGRRERFGSRTVFGPIRWTVGSISVEMLSNDGELSSRRSSRSRGPPSLTFGHGWPTESSVEPRRPIRSSSPVALRAHSSKTAWPSTMP